MARDLNKVMLTGHLGADPEMRFTPQAALSQHFALRRIVPGSRGMAFSTTTRNGFGLSRGINWQKSATSISRKERASTSKVGYRRAAGRIATLARNAT